MAADDVTRPTPWEHVFASVEDRYAAFGDPVPDPAAFSRHPEVQRLLTEIEAPALLEANPLAAAEYLHLLFADWKHWLAGRAVRTVHPDHLTLSSTSPVRSAAPPREPVYLRFARRSLWMQPDPDGPHEPLDGCYLVPMRGDELLVVAVLGLHRERAGLAQVTLTARAEDLDTATAELPDDAFTPAMAGGAQAGFRSVRSAAELLHLVRVASGHNPA